MAGRLVGAKINIAVVRPIEIPVANIEQSASQWKADLLRALADKIPAMLAYWDSNTRCQYANRAYEDWFGVSPESLIGRDISELLGPLYPLNLPYIEGALRGEPQKFEREIPSPSGGPPRHSLANYIPDFDGGVVRGFFVIVTDISEIKRAELALKESEAKFSGIVSISADAIVSVDEDQRIVLFNQGAEATFGWTAKEVIGKPLDVLIPERYRDAHRKHIGEFADSNIESRRIADELPAIWGLRKNGAEFPAEVVISKLGLRDKTLLTVSMRDISERKRIEDERQVFVALLDNSSDFIGIADPDGKPIYVNEAGRRMVGLPNDCSIEQTRIPDYYPPELRPFVNDVIIKSLAERGRWSGEIFFRHWQTQESIPVSDEHFMIRDRGSGRLLGIGTVTRNTTEVKRIAREREDLLAREQQARERSEAANEALRESEERFRLTVDEAPIGLALVALDGRFIRVNRVLCEVLGYTPEELTQRTFQTVTHPDDLDTDMALAGQLARGEIPRYQLEKRYVRKDGSLVNVMLSGSIVRTRDGAPLYYIAQIEDITDRKRTEMALRQAAAVFTGTNEAVIIADAQQRIVAVNNAFTRITGFDSAEVLGRNPSLQQSGRHDAAFFAKLWETLTSTGQWQGEIWNRRKNGEVYPAWENISAVQDERGNVVNYVAVLSDISSIKASEERLLHMAHHDALTNLPNRLLFTARLDQAIERAKRKHARAALLLLDLDRFKLINDTLGHDAGDRLLQRVAERLLHSVRAEDTVARLGGDEFAIVLDEIVESQDAARVAEKILHQLSAPITLEGKEFVVSASVGISLYPDDSVRGEDLVREADAAMYRAKRKGRHTLEFYAREMTAEAEEHVALEIELRRALDNREFALYYQPQLDLRTGRIVGVEALLRWHHPTRGLVMPAQIIKIAEDSELIVPIGKWVIEEAARQAAAWNSQGLPPMHVAVNVSLKQLTLDDFVASVQRLLQQAGLGGWTVQLDLEVTESTTSVERCVATLRALRALGVSVAIDDFGTGYSSLSRLKSLPIDILKLDQSFVCDIPRDEHDRAIATAIITLAHELKLTVVAEGVETREQLDFLRAQRCDVAQGFLICKPLNTEAITHWLQERAQDQECLRRLVS